MDVCMDGNGQRFVQEECDIICTSSNEPFSTLKRPAL